MCLLRRGQHASQQDNAGSCGFKPARAALTTHFDVFHQFPMEADCHLSLFQGKYSRLKASLITQQDAMAAKPVSEARKTEGARLRISLSNAMLPAVDHPSMIDAVEGFLSL